MRASESVAETQISSRAVCACACAQRVAGGCLNAERDVPRFADTYERNELDALRVENDTLRRKLVDLDTMVQKVGSLAGSRPLRFIFCDLGLHSACHSPASVLVA